MLGLGLELKKNNNRKYRPRNVVAYNPTTWAEWTIEGVGSTKGINGVHLVAQGSTDMSIFSTNCKSNTKYGLLYNVTETTLSSDLILPAIGSIQSTMMIIPKAISNNKAIFTTINPIVTNTFRLACSASNLDGGYINFKDIRIFELPTSSLIETDFTNLTADQLNTKYPF